MATKSLSRNATARATRTVANLANAVVDEAAKAVGDAAAAAKAMIADAESTPGRYAPDLTRGQLVTILATAEGNEDGRIPLRGVRLDGLDLANLSFDDCDLSSASLRGCNLRATSFEGANLTFADFSGSDMRESRIGCFQRPADITSTIFAGANLDNADLCGVEADGTDFTNTTLRDALLESAKCIIATFKGAILDGASVADMEVRPESPGWHQVDEESEW